MFPIVVRRYRGIFINSMGGACSRSPTAYYVRGISAVDAHRPVRGRAAGHDDSKLAAYHDKLFIITIFIVLCAHAYTQLL